MEDVKARIIGCVEDLVGAFLYYDRKEDEDLPIGAIEKAISDGDISVDEITAQFRKVLESNL